MTIERTYALADTLAVSFFEKYLAGTNGYNKYLEPAWYRTQPDLKVQARN